MSLFRHIWRPRPLLAEDATYRASMERAPLPRYVELDISGRCALRCRMCPTPQAIAVADERDESLMMDPQDLPRTFPAMADAERIFLKGTGEPFQHPQVLKILRMLKPLGIPVSITSNGIQINDEHAETAVVEDLADEIEISLEGLRKHTYESIRLGSDYGRLLSVFERFVRLQEKHGAIRPSFYLLFLKLPGREQEAAQVTAFARTVGAAGCRFQPLRADVVPDRTLLETPVSGGVPDQIEEVEDDESEGAATHRAGSGPQVKDCLDPWERIHIDFRMDVFPCGVCGWAGRWGNLKTQTFQEIWESVTARQFRAAMAGTVPPEPCRPCVFRRWKQAPRLPRVSGKVVPAEASGLWGPGWHDPEAGSGHRWTRGEFLFFLPRGRGHVLHLACSVPDSASEVRLAVEADETPLGVAAVAPGGIRELRFALPPAARSGRIIAFRGRVDRVWWPARAGDSSDQRGLGVAIHRLWVE